MSLFKDFKADISQAVSELMDDKEETRAEVERSKVLEPEEKKETKNTLSLEEKQVLFEKEVPKEPVSEVAVQEEETLEAQQTEEQTDVTELEATVGDVEEALAEHKKVDEFIEEQTAKTVEEEKIEETVNQMEENSMETMEKEEKMVQEEEVEKKEKDVVVDTANFDETPADDEIASITMGTEITGNVKTTGSLEVIGNIEGDVNCKGKLVVSGKIKGTSEAAEIFTDAAHVTGDMNSLGSIKVGVGSVIVGNIKATSAVIAGAVKGDIDVNGPIIVDSTAVVVGNIKSRSVQVNNGAVMEGLCSQSYSDIDVNTFFEN